MRKRPILFSLVGLTLLCLVAGLIAYNLPSIHDRLAWRVENLRTRIQYALNPPAQAVFVPQEQVDRIVSATLQALTLTPTASATPTLSPSATIPGPTPTPQPTPTPTLSPTPIPDEQILSGAVHEYQKFNNCGPANLSMALSFWGWQGDQLVTRDFLRPNQEVDDKNVMPAEMVTYVETQTQFKALTRVGGDLDLIKRLVAAGFPVIVEKGFELPKEDWMGHYSLVTGYSDQRGRLITQDSYIMADFPLPYDELEPRWRDFNYVYVVVYLPEREAELLSVLGPQADPLDNFRYAAGKAQQESEVLSGRDLYFALFNLGSSLVGLGDYSGAAHAYDQAFALYPSIPEPDRPWRMLWYQTGPYPAYFYSGRYQDVIGLAETTFAPLAKPGLEESFYWRGLAREALGDLAGATEDIQHAYWLNPNFSLALETLNRLGVQAP